MTIRLGGPLVGALVGLAAAALGAVFLTGGFDPVTLAVAAGSVVITAVVAVLTGRSIAPQAPRSPAVPPLTPAPGPGTGPIPVGQLTEPARAAQVMADRTVLVDACIWMRDRATSPALAQHLDGAFARVGVSQVDATGQRFDPSVHEAGSVIAAGSPAEDGIIARTETPGYTDRGRLLRHPIVTVYRGQVRA
ncbi:nucleotide exchange factor GrpE [Glycomyces sp. TRM65418]|uniref:nucleotide exchange factor GrpE n=1 Tax=Glycomyces sp. TRM65418 TaxID=2867006 RepID=UPI001CE57FB7|nr:nucleotide exchange factor GrpE [Glycomyces sp. TRM65418]MCC3763242.1 nucleotide exchange factor GrpE [Glycomyces sp. TRM65418]QZD57244.1 nucleotide exchange factor GrpE [Glycomyces sp. TRM65418]